MFIDLYHNHIVKNIITEKFSESVEKKLIPRLVEKYGASLLGIQMYEDYISEAFYTKGEWYYPLTVILATGPSTEWIKWRMKTGAFKDGLPYAYVGDGLLDINIVPEVPAEFNEKIAGRAICSTSETLKVKIETSATDPTFLSGRYSQSFVDEMARQLGEKISAAMSVSGIEGSTVSLSLVFAPGTFMEYTSENVTYRRLLISDASSSPRDFWVKWTREDGAMAYTVSDHVNAETIVFEIGEDVPQKYREREYRYLLSSGGDKYHNAMGRKNITEWRDLIKRAARRGELVKIEIAEADPTDAEVSAKIAALLGKKAIEKSAPAAPVEVPEDESFAHAMALARDIAAAREIEAVSDEAPVIPEYKEAPVQIETTEISFAEEIFEAEAVEAEPETVEILEIEAAEESVDLPLAKEAEEEPEVQVPVVTEFVAEEPALTEPSVEEPVINDVFLSDETVSLELFEEIEDEEALEESEAEIAELLTIDGAEVEDMEKRIDKTVAPTAAPAATEAQPEISREEFEAKIRAEVEARVRLEYESRARREAEAEAEKHRLEAEELRRKNKQLIEEAEAERERLAQTLEVRRAEDARMRAELEEQLRREAKERERFAEAAKIALEQARREEEEKAREEALAKAVEERRAAEERRAQAEAARAEEERRIAEEKAKKEKENEAIAGNVKSKNYTYTSKSVRLLFRRTVDPNITARIYEIIKTTLEYYGKDKMYMRIKATIPDTTTVILEFVEIPMEEMALLSNIIKVLGNSGLGIAKAVVE